jgi:hypothetical protein
MRKTFGAVTIAVGLCAAAVAAQQFPMVDMMANRIVQKYQTSTCDQLWQERSQGHQAKTPQEQHVIQMLQADPQMRAALINKVAAPVANKLFECGMIP